MNAYLLLASTSWVPLVIIFLGILILIPLVKSNIDDENKEKSQETETEFDSLVSNIKVNGMNEHLMARHHAHTLKLMHSIESNTRKTHFWVRVCGIPVLLGMVFWIIYTIATIK